VAEAVMSVAGKRVQINHRGGRRAEFAPVRLVSSRRAERELDWQAKIPYIDGVRDYWEWFCSSQNADLRAGRGQFADSAEAPRG
jgi:nucleoside-diphosphate-sugar epimerase